MLVAILNTMQIRIMMQIRDCLKEFSITAGERGNHKKFANSAAAKEFRVT